MLESFLYQEEDHNRRENKFNCMAWETQDKRILNISSNILGTFFKISHVGGIGSIQLLFIGNWEMSLVYVVTSWLTDVFIRMDKYDWE